MSPRRVTDPCQASKTWLKTHVCAWCEQTLWKAKQGHCGAIYPESRRDCHWVKTFATPRSAPPEGRIG